MAFPSYQDQFVTHLQKHRPYILLPQLGIITTQKMPTIAHQFTGESQCPGTHETLILSGKGKYEFPMPGIEPVTSQTHYS